MKRYSASVVGGGGGGRLSLTGLAASPRFALVAAADVRPDVCAELQRLYPGIRTFATHQGMFERAPTDVVCVSTYPSSHREVTIDALKLPLQGMLVEKPLGHTAAAGRDILSALRARKLPVAVPHGLLVAGYVLEILERVRSGEIGQLTLVEIECSGWDLMNAGIHWLDFFVTLCAGDAVEHVLAMCDSSTRTYRDGLQVETSAVTLVQMHSGVRCVMHTGDSIKIAREKKSTLFRIIGTQGMIEFWGWDQGYLLQNAQHPNGKLCEVPHGERTYHQRHLENLASQMDSRQPDYTIAENSLRALEICEAAYLSSRHRCKVEFPFEAFRVPAEQYWQPGEPYSGTGGGRDGRKL